MNRALAARCTPEATEHPAEPSGPFGKVRVAWPPIPTEHSERGIKSAQLVDEWNDGLFECAYAGKSTEVPPLHQGSRSRALRLAASRVPLDDHLAHRAEVSDHVDVTGSLDVDGLLDGAVARGPVSVGALDLCN